MDKVLEEALKGKNVTLLYCVEFGSKLYGTDGPNSDVDYKGIFLPAPEDMLLGNKCNDIHYTTGDNGSKNTKDDVDLQLWSLQHFLHLLAKGDTNALDLLFSMGKCTHVKKKENNILFRELYKYHPKELVDIRNTKAYVAYAYAQAKKYGLKGSRLAKLKEVIEYLTALDCERDVKLSSVADGILEKFFDESLCFYKEIDDKKLLYILGKGYDYHIKVSEALERLNHDYDRYGERAKQAERNEGIDWKAVSHAVRCLVQMLELIEKGYVTYPLKDAEYLKEIKYGKKTWQEVEQTIVDLLKKVDEAVVNVPENKNIREIHTNIILNTYYNTMN